MSWTDGCRSDMGVCIYHLRVLLRSLFTTAFIEIAILTTQSYLAP